MRQLIAVIATALLTGCASTGYTLVAPGSVTVSKRALKVRPSIAWNRAPGSAGAIAQEETWTQNGPVLDSITFIAGLKDGQAIVRQRARDDRQVPVFRATMSPQDLVSMLESYYRIRGGATVFETVAVQPATLAGQPAVQLDFRYLGGDDVRRRGRAVLAVIAGRLYLMSLEGTALHYFDAALPEFASLVASASL
ncbi:MAG: hypothetical protein IT480_02855 [Gammaproteobacteria bacterium]|nr:hypothetical protein [Gammaproteobacteria bacterium]